MGFGKSVQDGKDAMQSRQQSEKKIELGDLQPAKIIVHAWFASMATSLRWHIWGMIWESNGLTKNIVNKNARAVMESFVFKVE